MVRQFVSAILGSTIVAASLLAAAAAKAEPHHQRTGSYFRCELIENGWKHRCIKNEGDAETIQITNKSSEKVWFDIDEWKKPGCFPGGELHKEIVSLEKSDSRNSIKLYGLGSVAIPDCTEFYIINCRTDTATTTPIKCSDYLTVGVVVGGGASLRRFITP